MGDGTNTLTGQTLSITVTAVDDDTATVVNNSLTVAEGDVNTVLTTSDLSATDADSNDATLIYTVGQCEQWHFNHQWQRLGGQYQRYLPLSKTSSMALFSTPTMIQTLPVIALVLPLGDGTNTLTGQTLSITVTAVNDAPEFFGPIT